MRLPIIPIFLLALPFLEIADFVIVGRQVGVLATLALVVAAAVAGTILLRVQGLGMLARVRAELDAGRDPGRELANGVMLLLAGILLLIPGFVTDILGLLLLLPPARALAWRFLKDRVVISTSGFAGFARRGGDGRTIDLDADEYSHDPRADTPWRRIDRD
jgi:UPF0716 protein FxsA